MTYRCMQKPARFLASDYLNLVEGLQLKCLFTDGYQDGARILTLWEPSIAVFTQAEN